ncbi:hypothetical protein A3Q56_04921, partial [Intoshia linei]
NQSLKSLESRLDIIETNCGYQQNIPINLKNKIFEIKKKSQLIFNEILSNFPKKETFIKNIGSLGNAKQYENISVENILSQEKNIREAITNLRKLKEFVNLDFPYLKKLSQMDNIHIVQCNTSNQLKELKQIQEAFNSTLIRYNLLVVIY